MFKKLWKKYTRHIIIGVFIVFAGYGICFSSSLHQGIGNAFFGTLPKLYNVTLAQFFFEKSAYPLFGQSYPFAHYQLSRTHFIQGNFNVAIEEAKKELDIYPDNIRTYYILGLTYGYMNQERKAIEAFGKFIEYNPTSWAARNDKAWLEFRIGDIDAGLQTIQPVAHDINNPWVQNTYGTLLLNKKMYEEAKIAYLYAKKASEQLSETSWGKAYPGNDPRIYGIGLSAMKLSIESNIKLLENLNTTPSVDK